MFEIVLLETDPLITHHKSNPSLFPVIVLFEMVLLFDQASNQIPLFVLLVIVLFEIVLFKEDHWKSIPCLLLVMILFEIVLFFVLEKINHHNIEKPESCILVIVAHVVFSIIIPAGLADQRISNLCVGSNQEILILFFPLLEIYFPPEKFKTVFPIASPFATTATQSLSTARLPSIEAGTSSMT